VCLNPKNNQSSQDQNAHDGVGMEGLDQVGVMEGDLYDDGAVCISSWVALEA
jgi:hypothetical protein